MTALLMVLRLMSEPFQHSWNRQQSAGQATIVLCADKSDHRLHVARGSRISQIEAKGRKARVRMFVSDAGCFWAGHVHASWTAEVILA